MQLFLLITTETIEGVGELRVRPLRWCGPNLFNVVVVVVVVVNFEFGSRCPETLLLSCANGSIGLPYCAGPEDYLQDYERQEYQKEKKTNKKKTTQTTKVTVR